MSRRGQISTEYLIVIGFVVFLVLGILTLAFFYTSSTSDSIKISQLSNFANKIITASETVFYAGEPSKATFTAYLPKGVKNITLTQNEIIASVSTSSGVTTIAFTTNVPLSGSIAPSEGVKRIRIVAQINDVFVSEV